jgi:nucleoporin NUP82
LAGTPHSFNYATTGIILLSKLLYLYIPPLIYRPGVLPDPLLAMPKILSSTPQWLCRPSQGFSFFDAGPQRKQSLNSAQYRTAEYHGPHRLIAKRGTEVFAVVNNQIRWADLCMLKDEWELVNEGRRRRSRRSRSFTPDGRDGSQDERGEGKAKGYRVRDIRRRFFEIRWTNVLQLLNVGNIPQIRQLIPSPEGGLLAILTSHTIHIAILPDPSHLASSDESPIRLKTHQLGPTTHVLPESPVMSALWHPLGVDHSTLVTVTADASVRIWELRRDNQWSFDQPTLAIDLKKLIDGKSSDENFNPAPFGTNKGFSPDEVDMEVASACFGGNGLDEEDGWAPMTLWVAMRNRDLYALCPLLPSKWQPTATIIPSLSTNVVSKAAVLQDDTSATDVEQKMCEQQYRWFSEIDNQEPMISSSNTEIYNRPTSIGPIPKLQGPYAFDLPTGVDDDESEVTDVLIIAAKVDADELLQGEDEDADSELEALMAGGVSTTIICHVTETGKVFICIDLEGVQGQWLPKLRHKAFAIPNSTPSGLTLVTAETMAHPPTEPSDWPIFTQDILNRYQFFITSMKSVESYSLTSWAERLEEELSSKDSSGVAFRLKILCSAASTVAIKEDLIFNLLPETSSDGVCAREGRHLNGCLLFHDINLSGYFVLTSNPSRSMAVTLDTPDAAEHHALPSIEERARSATPAKTPSPGPDELPPRPRSPYQPSPFFYLTTPLTNFIESHVPSRHRQTIKKEIRLSPATLDIMTAAHRTLSQETNKLETAAADLFRRCERLREEMKDQVRRLRQIADKVNEIVDDASGSEEDEYEGSESKIDRRLGAAKQRQEELSERFETLRKKLSRSGGRELSDKERAWISEISRLEVAVLKEESEDEVPQQGDDQKPARQQRRKSEDELLWKRFETVRLPPLLSAKSTFGANYSKLHRSRYCHPLSSPKSNP